MPARYLESDPDDRALGGQQVGVVAGSPTRARIDAMVDGQNSPLRTESAVRATRERRAGAS